jgi:hypothetical protein
MPIIASRASAAYGAGFGKLLSAGGGGVTNFSAFDAIWSNTLTTTTTTVIIQGIPQDYNHLQLRIMGRGSGTDYRSGLSMRINTDDGVSGGYNFHRIWLGSGVNAGAGNADATAYNGAGFVNDSNGATDAFALSITDILDYTSPTKTKIMRTMSNFNNGATGANDGDKGSMIFTSGSKAISAITELQIFGSANLLANTTISLYGIR